MNRGGVCGTSQTFATTSYNDPKDENGNSFTPPVVATWRAGEVVEIKFTITAHHKGAVSLGLCKSLDVSQACFDEHPLEFVEDSRYGAPPDPNHPERGYIAPDTLDQSNEPGSMEIPFNGGMPFTMKFRVPESVGECEHCVLQWTYTVANTCLIDGYRDYNFPSDEWWNESLGDCPEPINYPKDGNVDDPAFVEQFWNCADIKVVASDATLPSNRDADSDTVTTDPETSDDSGIDDGGAIALPNESDDAESWATDNEGGDVDGMIWPPTMDYESCGGISTHDCNEDKACSECMSPNFHCVRRSQWYHQVRYQNHLRAHRLHSDMSLPILTLPFPLTSIPSARPSPKRARQPTKVAGTAATTTVALRKSPRRLTIPRCWGMMPTRTGAGPPPVSSGARPRDVASVALRRHAKRLRTMTPRAMKMTGLMGPMKGHPLAWRPSRPGLSAVGEASTVATWTTPARRARTPITTAAAVTSGTGNA